MATRLDVDEAGVPLGAPGWWAARRLHLSTLDRPARAIVVASLVTCVILAVVTLLVGAGWWDPPGGLDVSPRGADNEGMQTHRLVFLLGGLGLGMAAAAVVAATFEPGWRYHRAQRIIVGTFGGYIALVTLGSTEVLGREVARGGLTAAAELAVFIFAWTGLAAAAFTAFSRDTVGRRPLHLSCAAAPFVLFATAYATVLLLQQTPQTQPASAEFVEINWSLVLMSIFAWQFIQATRAGRDIAAVTGRLTLRFPWLLVTLLAAKAAWLGLGYGGALDDEHWQASRSDGPVAWAIATLLALAAGAWLLRGERPRPSDRGVAVGAWVAVGGFMSGFAITALALIPHEAIVQWTDNPHFRLPMILALMVGAAAARWRHPPTWLVAPLVVSFGVASAATVYVRPVRAAVLQVVGVRTGSRVKDAAATTIDAVGDIGLLLSILGVLAAGIVGVVVLRKRPSLYGTWLFLVVFGAWNLPRAISAFEVERLGADLSSPSRFTVTVVTLDAVITAVVVILALLWWGGGQRTVGPAQLVVILVVATATAHAGSLVPSFLSRAALFAGLGFAVGYGYLMDAESLNIPSSDRTARVVAAVGLACGASAFYTLATSAGVINRDQSSLIQLLFGVPVAATLVAATITSLQQPAIPYDRSRRRMVRSQRISATPRQ